MATTPTQVRIDSDLAIRYIVREKRKGVHCIGCPMAGSCTEAYKQMEADMRKCLKKEEL